MNYDTFASLMSLYDGFVEHRHRYRQTGDPFQRHIATALWLLYLHSKSLSEEWNNALEPWPTENFFTLKFIFK